MWIVCYADNSHQIPSFIFPEKKTKHLEMYLLLVLSDVLYVLLLTKESMWEKLLFYLEDVKFTDNSIP